MGSETRLHLLKTKTTKSFDTIVVIPTYNEAENIETLLERLFAAVPDIYPIFVDDGSPDNTAGVLRGLSIERNYELSVIYQKEKEGLSSAYQRGFGSALTILPKIVVQMDADLSHAPEDIPWMIALLEDTGSDVVVGSRYCEGGRVSVDWPRYRRILSKGANGIVRKFARLKVHDATSGFKVFKGDALYSLMQDTFFNSKGFAFQVEMARACEDAGLKVIEFPIDFEQRRKGRSKLTLGIGTEVLQTAWRLSR